MRKYRRSKKSPVFLEKKTITTIVGISFIAFAALLLISFFSSAAALVSIRESFYQIFGATVILVPLLIVFLGLPLMSIKTKFAKVNVVFGITAAILSLAGMIAPFSTTVSGKFGSLLWDSLKAIITPVGAFSTLFFALLISCVIALNSSIDQTMETFASIFRKFKNLLKAKDKFFSKKPSFATRASMLDKNSKSGKIPELATDPGQNDGLTSNPILNQPGQVKIWEYPPLSLLSDASSTANRGNIKHNAQTIEKTLESFGVVAKVVEYNPGPTVTQYALEIPMGTKLSKILSLQNDLALALATSTGNVRIEAPIPGKSLVGVEIPNVSPAVVSLKSVLSAESMQRNKSKTAIGLGLSVSGDTVIADIAKMPHVLIAGTTGSGKSVLLNTLIATLLFRASPQEVKLILVDPKRVELTDYNDIPHLLTPVIVEPEKILSALKWASSEMDRRYKLFHEAQVRNITGYNELSGFQALPYIVIVIDELQNLMEFAPVEVEKTIVRLAAMARATGVHLVVATQRPSVDVITGIIKANIPCRIAFNVSSMVDSRVIIDQPGSEKLLGKGDMLYVPPDATKPMRIQGVYASDSEIRNLISFLKNSGVEPEYTQEIIEMPIGKAGTLLLGEKDDLFDEAVRTVCQYDRASASLLQRRLRIGYARAARLIDELETAGIVGPGEGSKPRDVLVKNAEEYLESQSEPTPASP